MEGGGAVLFEFNAKFGRDDDEVNGEVVNGIGGAPVANDDWSLKVVFQLFLDAL